MPQTRIAENGLDVWLIGQGDRVTNVFTICIIPAREKCSMLSALQPVSFSLFLFPSSSSRLRFIVSIMITIDSHDRSFRAAIGVTVKTNLPGLHQIIAKSVHLEYLFGSNVLIKCSPVDVVARYKLVYTSRTLSRTVRRINNDWCRWKNVIQAQILIVLLKHLWLVATVCGCYSNRVRS